MGGATYEMETNFTHSLEKFLQILFCDEPAQTRNVNFPIVGICVRSLFLSLGVRNEYA